MIYDVEQLTNALDKEVSMLDDTVSDWEAVPVIGRVTLADNKEHLLDLLGLEYDESDNTLYVNLGARHIST